MDGQRFFRYLDGEEAAWLDWECDDSGDLSGR